VVETLVSSPWKSLGLGFAFLILVPSVVIILAITLIGIPISIFCLFIYVLAIYLSKVFVGLAIGERLMGLFRREREGPRVSSLILGMIILALLVNIPYIGGLIWLASIMFGIGAFVISRFQLLAKLKEKEII
jgi:hypothetical protein